MIVIVAPGQGSQKPGFLAPWLDLPGVPERLGALGEAAGIDLVEHGTVSDADTIRDTLVAQPLIVAAGILALDALGDRARLAGGVAGHSVGEITAAVAAGVLSAEDAMALVGERARAMADAAATTPTGMAAVLGADEGALEGRLAELGLEPANYNGGGQIVVAGAVDALAALAEAPPERARVIPLQTAGAFHTGYMAPAVERFRAAAAATATSDPTTTLWTNRDGSAVASGADFLELIVGQVSSPVRWDRCMAAFQDAGVTGIIELAPAGALIGLAKRGLRGVPSVGITTPDDLDAAVALLESGAAA
ncbi:ACP S-malonyltransferase [Agrococcus jenensis]|uniref:[acyl-carrier-protein] S-malonyltransferase n=1 Tax=Agrococcus jenensis TaxID=46353 RepID=A0A3N2AW19_9MICO|nr:ACP S-malonyltransferase [Agrococcus jenensis]ROR67175.1 [acyl-carrier-protein] S-malonyltransferase [Agrococcus jenensis]